MRMECAILLGKELAPIFRRSGVLKPQDRGLAAPTPGAHQSAAALRACQVGFAFQRAKIGDNCALCRQAHLHDP
jgi:hypothetical protein